MRLTTSRANVEKPLVTHCCSATIGRPLQTTCLKIIDSQPGHNVISVIGRVEKYLALQRRLIPPTPPPELFRQLLPSSAAEIRKINRTELFKTTTLAT